MNPENLIIIRPTISLLPETKSVDPQGRLCISRLRFCFLDPAISPAHISEMILYQLTMIFFFFLALVSPPNF